MPGMINTSLKNNPLAAAAPRHLTHRARRATYRDYMSFRSVFPICRQLRTVKLHQISIIFNAALKRFEDRDFNPAVSDPTVSE